MSEVKEFFRHCPACGRRFHIKLVSKKLVGERKEVAEIKQAMVNPTPMGYSKTMPAIPLIVEENIPITIDVEDFQYSYRCKHCGHEWSETRTEETKK
jgi:transposase-like protein